MHDLISRQAAIDALERKKDKNAKGDVGGFYNKIIQNDIDALMQLPPAQPERKKGKWINGVCDQCGSHAPYWAMASTYYRSSFCPNCGADMRGKQNDSISD